MTNKPDGKPETASDDARASDGKDADTRRDKAVEAANQRVDVQKEKADALEITPTATKGHASEDPSKETDLMTEALEKSSDA